MTEKQKDVHCDENGNITKLTEDDLPKCPRTGGISPRVWIIGGPKEDLPKVEHINCRCNMEITCNSADSDFDLGDVE